MAENIDIILIGNYQPDRLESMDRFAEMLKRAFRNAGVNAEIWYPRIFLGRYTTSTIAGMGKWLGYVDKWILNPILLGRYTRKRMSKNPETCFHVCDHSNAPYLKYLPGNRSGITCHDVLAMRGAFGFTDACCPASPTGRFFQKWILHHLSRARFLACVSHATLDQLKELAAKQINRPRHWTVIHNSLNGDFKRLPDGEAKTLLQKAGIDSMTPFVLHVGSALPRKNRKLLVRMLALLDKRWHGNVCFAGEAMEEPLLVLARSLSLEDRIVSVVKPDHDTLTALYNLCEAFIFPSFSEGFGWPLLEAQACGAPVIASNIAPLAEISAGTALHADPDKPQQFAEALLSLQDDMTRSTLIRKGFRNTLRFDSVAMASAYLDLYEIRKNKLNECVA